MKSRGRFQQSAGISRRVRSGTILVTTASRGHHRLPASILFTTPHHINPGIITYLTKPPMLARQQTPYTHAFLLNHTTPCVVT